MSKYCKVVSITTFQLEARFMFYRLLVKGKCDETYFSACNVTVSEKDFFCDT